MSDMIYTQSKRLIRAVFWPCLALLVGGLPTLSLAAQPTLNERICKAFLDHQLYGSGVWGFDRHPLIERFYVHKPPEWINEFYKRTRVSDPTVEYPHLLQRATTLQNIEIIEFTELKGYQRKVKMTDLQPGTKYRVKLANGREAILSVSTQGAIADAGVQSEVAAFRLAHSLGLELVPPTVFRTVNRLACALQEFVSDASSEDSNFNFTDMNQPKVAIRQMLFEFMDDGDMVLFYTIFGQWDGHKGNRIRRLNGRLRLIDNEEIGRRSLMTLSDYRLTERGRTRHIPLPEPILPEHIVHSLKFARPTTEALLPLLNRVMSPEKAAEVAAKLIQENQNDKHVLKGSIAYSLITDASGVERLFLETRRSSNPIQLFRAVTFMNDPIVALLRELTLAKLDLILPPTEFPALDKSWRLTVLDRISRLPMQLLRAQENNWIPYSAISMIYPDFIYLDDGKGELLEFEKGVPVKKAKFPASTILDAE